MARMLCFDIHLDTYFPHFTWLPLQFSLALGPFIYFYVLKVTRPEHDFGWRDILHFAPVLPEQLILLLEIKESIITGKATYDTLSFQQMIPVLQLAAFISVIIYLYLSFRLIENYYARLKFNDLGDRNRLGLRWLHRSLSVLGSLWLLWIPFTAINYFYYHNAWGIYAYYPLYLLVTVAMIRIAATAFLKPEGQATVEETAASRPTASAALKEKGRWLRKAMENDRFYLEPDLSLSTLAEKLNIHPHELSRIINGTFGKNFNDFINEYRILEVTQKMQDTNYDRLTVLGIAFDSGFNSKSTFNRTFREITGKSPAAYKTDLKKGGPTYHLRPYSRSAAIISYQKATPSWPAEKLNRNFMFKNYLKIAWRNLVRQRLYSLINISGLAVGLAVCMLIMLYVAHEHSYDRFHKNADRIFRPFAETKINGNTMYLDHMSYASGQIIKQSQPTVEDYMRTLNYFRPAVITNPSNLGQKFSENKLVFADAGFFSFFSFKLLSGQASQVLSAPFSVVISQAMARKYFGNENPVGRQLTIRTDSAYTYQVTGVAENCPSNSSIEYNFVASNSGLIKTKIPQGFIGEQRVGSGAFNIYLLLKHRADTAALRRSLQSFDAGKEKDPNIKFSLFPFLDQHLKRSYDNSNFKYLTIFPLVALLILLLALFNYMSLSTARATLRAKEIGVRKVSGASRKGIAMQFYVESAVFSVISFVLGCLLCFLFKPVFLNILQLEIDTTFLFSPLILFLLLGLLILTILLAGSYPSLVLSGFKPAVTLKGKMGKQTGGVIIRKVFTTLQFSISVGLIICGIVIDRQLYFFRHTETGVDRDNIIMIPAGNALKSYHAFKQDVMLLPGITNVATSRYGMFVSYDMIGISGTTKEGSMMLRGLSVDKNFFSILGLKWKYPPIQDSRLDAGSKVFINELAIEKLHLPTNPLGSFINPGPEKIEIAGVVKNFNFGSLENEVQPLGLFVTADTSKSWERGFGGRYLLAKVKPHTNLPTLISSIQGIFKKYDSDTPFDYSFMDDAFNAQYKAEDKLAAIFSVFTVITIVLAAMGLFGLAAFTIEQRTKEIGIRKVLGASTSSINSLLSIDFLKLVLLSIVVASPIAWWAMDNWLQGFAYRIPIKWWMFGAAGFLAIIVALLTVSYHAVKASIANPVQSLRSE
ncbi:ABC transporter permease [Mucilaginibacter sp. SMC90]|uniref:ABC transporter permease n=1 Tax=Mucilaginibacter sp. SMC90 TaxID=2929803 RepID=UPI001FB55319|nr:ABC transporter permease [Mucilaginibacter sp. SMC90]UOE52152.1 ABC transporter permease [Mucilaginibacter sp. SMC90]